MNTDVKLLTKNISKPKPVIYIYIYIYFLNELILGTKVASPPNHMMFNR